MFSFQILFLITNKDLKYLGEKGLRSDIDYSLKNLELHTIDLNMSQDKYLRNKGF